jgi:hypothetical protein
MRLWSLHPSYLDAKGLVALWREGLLAQAVLAGETRGYRRHPQLLRFLESPEPQNHLAAYLKAVFDEAFHRGYHFDERKIRRTENVAQLTVTVGQLHYEWSHLTTKLQARSPSWFDNFSSVEHPDPHPLFRVIEGGIAQWEIVKA